MILQVLSKDNCIFVKSKVYIMVSVLEYSILSLLCITITSYFVFSKLLVKVFLYLYPLHTYILIVYILLILPYADGHVHTY
jgi:hypothetical protein